VSEARLEGGVQVKESPVRPVARVDTGFRLVEGPLSSLMVTGPTASFHFRVKDWPAVISKAELVNEGLAETAAARAPTTVATENFMVTVVRLFCY